MILNKYDGDTKAEKCLYHFRTKIFILEIVVSSNKLVFARIFPNLFLLYNILFTNHINFFITYSLSIGSNLIIKKKKKQ